MSLNTWSLNVSLHNNKLTQANTAFSSYFETGLFRELWCERAWLWGTWVSLCCLEVLQTVNDTDLSVSMFVCNTAQGSMLNASIQCYWSRTDTSIGINTTTHNHMCPRDVFDQLYSLMINQLIYCIWVQLHLNDPTMKMTSVLQKHFMLTGSHWLRWNNTETQPLTANLTPLTACVWTVGGSRSTGEDAHKHGRTWSSETKMVDLTSGRVTGAMTPQ